MLVMLACFNKFFKISLSLILLLTLGACANLKELTSYAPEGIKQVADDLTELDKDISTEEEIQIGEQMISGILGAAPVVANPQLQKYVNDVGAWVARQTVRDDLPWHFAVIDSGGINAFAAPGGYIVLTRGLFKLIENEAQLAGVLAHEVGHVVGKHHLIAVKNSMKQEYWVGLGTKLLGTPEGLTRLVNAGLKLYATGLDREYEYLADSRAVVFSARAGYDPYAFLNVLAAIDNINPSEESLTVLLKTHPPTQDRISRLLTKMDGKLNRYADGRVNTARFKSVMRTVKP
ncbi:MAG: M48 family metalloprotease [Gammaproteobacteria bacterium]|nr:M48 family metalloprotease [Gammaproteobacteria bacterium]